MAFEASTTTNYVTLFDRIRAALKDPNFMGYDLTLSSTTGVFALGESVTFTGGAAGVIRQIGIGGTYLLVDTITGGVPGGTATGGTSGATAGIAGASSREWTEVLYVDATTDPPVTEYSIDKQLVLKNTGDGGDDEIWIMLEQYTNPGTPLLAGFRINGATSFNGEVGGWASLAKIVNGNVTMPLPNTGNADRDALKYWLVADRKRIIVATHMEYLLGAGMVTWLYNGYLTRWDPPDQYAQPHALSGPQNGMGTAYNVGTPHSVGYSDSYWIIDPDSGSTISPGMLKMEPPIANPDGSHAILPMWAVGFTSYLGEFDALFYTDPNVGQGETFSIGPIGYVCLQDYTPGHYAVLKLW